MPSEACREPASPVPLTGIRQFNRGEFFECHRTLEELWAAESRTIRGLYQGILQIGVAFHHLRAGRYQPALTLLERGGNYLKPFAPTCKGVDIEGLRASTVRCWARVKALGPAGVNEFDWSGVPRIEIIE
jgi:predicted metal-dependent hydrolase